MLAIGLVALASAVFASPDQPVVEPLEVTKTYAASGDPTAQFNLGVHFTTREKDIPTGIGWYKRAAEGGFAPAQFNLGVLYANGVNVPRDDKEAIKWLSRAAQQGIFEAQKILIEFYTEGRGVPKNPVAALGWDFIARRTLELRHGQPAGTPPHPPVLRKDGSAELVTKDGTKKILHPDGGDETIRPDGTRVITYKEGKVKVISPDGTERTNLPGGFFETVYPDGRKSAGGPNGTVVTTHPDGRKDTEGGGKDKYGRPLRITEQRDKDGKLTGRTVVRGNVTVRENASGPYVVETLVDDVKGVKMKLTEEVSAAGEIGQRKLVRVEDCATPKGRELWSIQREIEPGDGTTIFIEEHYGPAGLEGQRVIKKTPIQAVAEVAVTPTRASEQGMGIGVYIPPPEFNIPRSIPIRGGSAEPILKEAVNIQPMLKELEELEWKGRHFAGATEADWLKAKAAVPPIIPLGNMPQKPGAAPSWLSVKQISGSTLPVFPFTPANEDFSKQFPFGLHALEVVSRFQWKHAQTPHFIVHYVEETDARLSMQFLEGAYSVIGSLLALDPQRGNQKGHVFLFANETDWLKYLAETRKSNRLAGFAYKNELLLPAASGREGREDLVKTLCHEVTHAIVARFYPGARPPLWLNEGIAEYIAARTIAAKRGHAVDKYMSTLADRPMNVDEVFRRIRYGLAEPGRAPYGGGRAPGVDPVLAFYANAAWCVRVLAEKLPPEGLPKFFNALSAGNTPDAAFAFAYGPKCPDTKAFTALVNAIEMPKPAKDKK